MTCQLVLFPRIFSLIFNAYLAIQAWYQPHHLIPWSIFHPFCPAQIFSHFLPPLETHFLSLLRLLSHWQHFQHIFSDCYFLKISTFIQTCSPHKDLPWPLFKYYLLPSTTSGYMFFVNMINQLITVYLNFSHDSVSFPGLVLCLPHSALKSAENISGQ